MIYQFWTVFLALVLIFLFFDARYGMLRDMSQANPKPYSWGRVQLAWWTAIILSVFIAIYWKTGNLPDLHYSTIVLLGISAATTTTSRLIDVSDVRKAAIRHQDIKKDNFLLDILSDENGVSIHRFQTVVFNITFGIWFIKKSLQALGACNTSACDIDAIMPIVTDTNLTLLGVSAAAYAAMKSTENSVPATATALPANTTLSTTATTVTTTTAAPSNP